MARRDPEKTARNKKIARLKTELQALLAKALQETGIKDLASLNAQIGSKTDDFINLQTEVITSEDMYAALWFRGLKAHLGRSSYDTAYDKLHGFIKTSPAFKEYLYLFLRRSYLKHYDELSKNRPSAADAELWIGANNAEYGILISPRFRSGEWENDKSEIRHFKPRYWSIGHILETGLCVPGESDRTEFADLAAFLHFYKTVLVRNTASPHQKAIAKLYCDFVKASPEPKRIPILIPELRYAGKDAKHKHRLDFCIIDSENNNRIGFELSPSSTHCKITDAKNKTQKQINEEVAAFFQREADKLRNYFKKFGIYTLTYSDKDLEQPQAVFEDIKNYIEKDIPKQLQFEILHEFLS